MPVGLPMPIILQTNMSSMTKLDRNLAGKGRARTFK
jgi:hypothetical protein